MSWSLTNEHAFPLTADERESLLHREAFAAFAVPESFEQARGWCVVSCHPCWLSPDQIGTSFGSQAGLPLSSCNTLMLCEWYFFTLCPSSFQLSRGPDTEPGRLAWRDFRRLAESCVR